MRTGRVSLALTRPGASHLKVSICFACLNSGHVPTMSEGDPLPLTLQPPLKHAFPDGR